MAAPSSTVGMASMAMKMPPPSQASSTQVGSGKPDATTDGLRMMPEPTTPPTTTARPKPSPKMRSR